MTSSATRFETHNVRLPNGLQTIPGRSWLIAESPWLLSAMRVLRLVYGGRLAGRKLADLGCLEGGYTLEFAKSGLDATGIEVRQSNIEACRFLHQAFPLSNLRYVHDDAWNFREHGQFDIVFCCGLLYHLDRPREFLRMLSEQTAGVMILNTHVATKLSAGKFRLSDVTNHEGLPGRWYSEHSLDDLAELEKYRLSSWSNKKSFWLTRAALVSVLEEIGFDIVFEQFDWVGRGTFEALTAGVHASEGRAMFVGIRSNAEGICGTAR